MTEILHARGKPGFIFLLKHQLDVCLSSSLLCIIINALAGYLINNKERIKVLLKVARVREDYIIELNVVYSHVRKKGVIFLIFNYIVVLVCWFYVTCFCYCYPGSQKLWIYSSLLTLFIDMTFQFFFCFLITIMRYAGKACKSDAIFRLSQFLAE